MGAPAVFPFRDKLAPGETLLLNEIVPEASATPPATRNAWKWIPTLYFAEGLPNAIVTTISIVLYKAVGVSNARIAVYTSLFYLPWVIKPLWSPVVDILKTRRIWIWRMQCVLGLAFAGLAVVLPGAHFVPLSLILFWLIALSSATHDIAADGFYILALSEGEQSFFVGVRNTLYRVATLFLKGPFIFIAAEIKDHTGNETGAWAIAFAGMAALFGLLGAYHGFILPRPAGDKPGEAGSLPRFFSEFLRTFAAFFKKPKIVALLLFLVFYRFGEAQLLPMVQPFLLDPHDAGGLALSEKEFSVVYGTVGVIALLAGGILGGILVSRSGLRAWIWPMVLVMHLPDAVFIYLSHAQPTDRTLISSCVALEQFGYGFGFTAYMLYMIYIARGQHSTAHYAICTGFMALGLMLPGLWSGKLQELLGYQHFFVWVMLATVPGFIVTALIPLDAEFGKRSAGISPARR
ncbi:MAG TPA: MFS transporter [Verrucomicrobiae bacterium]|jgi:PAT family beta-lactamase induction signal transducer AmpG|nr:MFS transporter [Verrucomicrobiae bacterium]